MGIHGLLPFLKPYVKKINIDDFKGKTVGVDAMCWMHKGAFACSRELVEGVDTDKFVRYFLRMCEVLRCSRIKPIIVFDGDRLPAKAKEDENRGKAREKARLEALELISRQQSGHEVDEKDISSKCEGAIKVTSSMISRLQSALRELSIDFIIAPYEADAQLAYMCRMGWIDVAVSEDSDLLAYGCPSTLFKMDKFGNGDHIALPCLQVDARPTYQEKSPPEGSGSKTKGKQRQRLKPGQKAKKASVKACKTTDESQGKMQSAADGVECSQPQKGSKVTKGKSEADKVAVVKEFQSCLDRWSPEQFTEFCVFCGTDYKEPETHIKKFGIKTAFQFMKKYGNTQDLLKWMVSDKGFQQRLPCAAEEYVPRFVSVVCVFWHHLVFNLRSGECTSISTSFPLTETRRDCSGMDPATVCGKGFLKLEAVRVAKGDLDPRTRTVKKLEPLSPAERAVIDSILEFKRREQREYRQQVAAEQAEAQRAEAEAQKAMQEEALNCGIDESLPEEPTVQQESREIKLLAGDFKRLQQLSALRDDWQEAKSAPPRTGESMGNGTSRGSNPFGRKRPSQDANVKESMNGIAVPAKKSLCLRQTVRCVVAPRASVDEDVKFKKPEHHPRGGGGAKTAVEAVLAQRGVPAVEVDENKARSKLMSFFDRQAVYSREDRSKSPSKADTQKVDIIASWKSRPWEEEPEAVASAPRHNPLSLRNQARVFRQRV
ncbi:exo1 [Symbiodinium natans]|uniref:Exonuclease 1 n=1 Tax=Symbiodinium natans TaxID=878477 RepID=A0A812IDN2_9DINO|nr:exo1 [Symbiodinium natans]